MSTATAAQIKTLLFCPSCGTLLDRSPGTNTITCTSCASISSSSSTSNTVVSTSSAKAFPSKLRQKLSAVQTIDAEDLGTEAKISQKCPECGAQEMWFYTLQLRSADEGATVFYRCECGHRFNTNN